MNEQNVLERAVMKAVSNGFKWLVFFGPNGKLYTKGSIDEIVNTILKNNSYLSLIYDHEFAKALWGVDKYPYTPYAIWAHHLQQMVLSDYPLNYLRKNI